MANGVMTKKGQIIVNDEKECGIVVVIVTMAPFTSPKVVISGLKEKFDSLLVHGK